MMEPARDLQDFVAIDQAFDGHAQSHPHHPAILTDGGIQTAADINHRANVLAAALVARGVVPGEAVGVFVHRSAQLPFVFLAIQRAGAVYVPLAADHPPARLLAMVEDAAIRFVVAMDSLVPPVEVMDRLAGLSGGLIDPVTALATESRDAPLSVPRRTADDIAAILFTSGSTGRPKGVLIRHGGIAHMARGHAQAQGVHRNDRFLLSSAPGFILGFRELCLPLYLGATQVPATRALLDDPAALLALMERHAVSVASFTPSYLRLLDGCLPAGLRCLMTAGERPNIADALHYGTRVAYWNMHGATEVCGTICLLRVTPEDWADADRLPSGRPFPGIRVLILDGEGNPLPAGEVGEVHVLGEGLSPGYLNQPDLTARTFVDTAFGRAYRTGDMGRWREDGLLEALGRRDDMVKVSGQAVALAEIERALARHPGVTHASVVLADGGLVGFVAGTVSPGTDWTAYLATLLPAYMVPARVITLPRLPTSSAGKIDRQALLTLARNQRSARVATPDTLPQGDLELAVAAAWQAVLGPGLILRDDNFFSLGGTSLRAIEVAQHLQALGHAATVQDVLSTLTVRSLATHLAAGGTVTDDDGAEDEGPATVGQADFWLAHRLGLAGVGHHVVRVLEMAAGQATVEEWRAAWHGLVADHPALRTAFKEQADGAVHWQTLADLAAPDPALWDCADEQDARDRLAAAAAQPFDLTQAPLVRAGLIRLPTDGGRLLFWVVAHHAVVDGLAMGRLQDDLARWLRGDAAGPAAHGIRAAATAEARYLASAARETDQRYWRDQLDVAAAGGDDVLADLATDYSRPATPQRAPAAPRHAVIPAAAAQVLARLARTVETGLHGLLLALLGWEAQRRSGRSRVIIGSGFSIRPSGAETAIGHYVNVLPLVLNKADNTLAGRLADSRDTLRAALTHARYPGSWIAREFQQRWPGRRAAERPGLFDITLTANPPPATEDAPDGMRRRPLPGLGLPPLAGVDLAFSYEWAEAADDQAGDDLRLVLHWNPDVYAATTAQAWLDSLVAWAEWLAADSDRLRQSPPALLAHEAATLAVWEAGPTVERPAVGAQVLFQDWARRQPDAAAVVTLEETQSYADLDAAANGVANALLALDLGPDRVVAVLTDCAPALPAVILGIWKAGAVYLPLAADLPAERLAYMVSDAGAKVLITVPSGDGQAPPPALLTGLGPVLDAGTLPSATSVDHAGAGPDDLAYIIYTSGTTGRPKGVAVTHRGYVNTILSHAGTVGLTHADRTSLVATPGFDASPWELGMALLNGGGLVPISPALRDDPWALKRHYTRLGVTCAFHAPSYLRVSAETPFQGLRILNTGGEAPRHGDAARHGPPIAFWNAYGPTETTIIVTIGLVEGDADPRRPLSIGRPLANTSVSLRRDDGTPVPPGEVGELWLAGAGVARGYLNNPELTADRFVMTDQGRAYRSGDLGRWTADGRLELRGRMDQQVKLHGQRVELGEIEAALLAHPAMRQAAVLVSADTGHMALRAFLVAKDDQALPTRDTWQAWLAPRLPAHMIPASYTPVAAIPTTASGKIDGRALLALAPALEEGARTPPTTALEQSVAGVWATLLGPGLTEREPRVAREDNFFALGGNSLLAVTMAHQLAQALGRPVPARDLFIAPTLAQFAAHLAATEIVADSAVIADVDPTLATLGEREFWLAEAAGLDTGHFTMPLTRRVEGPPPDAARWNAAWQALVARHSALRTTFAADADGVVRRHVRAPGDAVFAELEFTTVTDRAAALAHIRDRQCAPLSLRQAPLYRAGVVTVAEGEALFWLALHHAVGDGASLEVLVRDLGTLLRGDEFRGPAVDAVALARQEVVYLAGPGAARDAQAWGAILRALPDAAFAEWSLDHPRRLDAPARSHRLEAVLPAHQADALRRLARRGQGSLHALMLTLLGSEVFRRTGRSDFLIGSTVSLREDAAVAEAVGYAVTLVPVAFQLTVDQNLASRFDIVRNELTHALHHARYPFARLCHDLWRERPAVRDPARFPLFDIVVTETPDLTGTRDAGQAATGLARLSAVEAGGIHYELAPHGAGQDMALSHEALPDGSLVLKWQMNAAIYDVDTAHHWLKGLLDLAAWLADGPAMDGAVPAALPSEQALLARWQAGSAVFRPDARPVDLIAAQAAARPEHPALILADGAVVSYAALLGRANRLARGLVVQGVTPGTVVAIVAPRGAADLPAVLLALWQAGAVYLPLAADLPPERREFMARDAGAAHILDLTADGLAALERAAQDDIALPQGRSNDIAYILYTSGSTGLPKGVRVSHAALLNTLLGVGDDYGLTAADRTLMFASPAFDVSLSDIGLPLVFGATLCLATAEVIERPAALLDLIRDRGVTVADLTPTYLRLLDGALPDSVRILVTGGEAPLTGDVARYGSRLRYVNAYGPTENAITSTMGALPVAGLDGVLATGRPLPNTLVEIRDATGALAAPGAVGEIWLGGLNLAEGYLNRPDLTAAAFIGEGDQRRYRTGDLGRWRGGHDGGLPVLEVLGRRDHQVKLNGIRIELGEIEAALEAHPAVAQAVVALEAAPNGEPGRKSLWAFVRPQAGSPREWLAQGWRETLAGRLPAYMIPAALLVVDAIPTTTSGKIDRAALRALLALSGAQADAGPVGGPPQGPVEERIAAAWRDVLGCGAVGREDDFFRLGGHSLLAIAVSHQLEKAFGHPVPARELFSDPTLRGFARRVAQLGQGETVVVGSGSDRATEGQREFWVAEGAGLDTRAFTMALALTVTGAVPDDAAWRRAWTGLVQRHDALRCHFEEAGEGVLRRPVLDAAAAGALVNRHFLIETAADADAALAQARGHAATAIPLGQPPLWRAGLVRAPDTAVFWLGLHHAVGDGLSLAVLIEDLTALLKGQALEALPGGLALTAAWEEAYLASPAADADAAYWRDTLDHLVASPAPEGNGPFDEWPLDAPRPLGRSGQAAKGSHSLRLCLDANTSTGLRRIAQGQGASLHALMLALMAIEVRRRTGRAHFTLGTAASTRETADEARVVGYYLNMLPLACHLAEGDTLAEVLAGVQQSLADGLGHSRYPTARILGDFRGQYPHLVQPGRFPLFDMAVTENPGDMSGDAGHDAAWRFVPKQPPATGALDYRLTTNAPAQDMVLAHEARADGSHALQLFVNATIYDQDTAESWALSLAALARHVAQGAADQPLPTLLPDEVAQLARWEHGPELASPASRFDRLFQDLARAQPEAPALITAAGVRTYAEVDAEIGALAAALRLRGLRRGQVVGVLTDRSPALPAAVLAVWRAGGAYVPLTSDLPGDRLAFIAQDAGAQMILALDGHTPPDALAALGLPLLRPEEVRDVSLADEDLPQDVGADPAYILYTSGSTGTPKGVVITHAGLMNLAVGMGERFGITPADRVLTLASPTFDLWVSDVVMAWGAGAALSPLIRAEMDDIAAMPALIAGRGITVATMAPSYLRLFERADLPPLRILMTVGEAPIAADARHYAGRLACYNGYGPTENTAATTIGRIDPDAPRLTAGRPLPNIRVMILDAQGRQVPPGAIGEIWVAGDSLAQGYLNRADLTKRAFPTPPDGRRYRTGDLGRWTAGGELLVLGRTDGQVKLRGQRVELGEIAAAIEAQPGVCQAVVLVHKDPAGNQALYAFATGANLPDNTAWREALAQRLPSYMLPAAVIPVESIPTTLAGKVDQASLRARIDEYRLRQDGGQRATTPPQGPVEERIAAAWRDVLGCGAVGREDDFFRLGGHSLLAIAVSHQLEKAFGHPVPARELFSDPTLRGFARRVAQLGQGETVVVGSGSDRATEGQREFWVAEGAGLDTRAFTMALALTVTGAVPDDAAWRRAWTGLVQRHDALRCHFEEAGEGVLRRPVLDAAAAGALVNRHFLIETAADADAALAQARGHAATAIPLGQPPLWRAGLVRTSDTAVFWLGLHHAVGDGLSLAVLIEDLTALLKGQALEALPGGLALTAAREEAYLASPAADADAAYWRDTLDHLVASPAPEGNGPFDEWPLDAPRPLGRSSQAAKGSHSLRLCLDADTTAALRRIAQGQGASLHALMLALMAIEVRRRTGRAHFTLGTAASTRETADEARVVGYYLNMLPLACHLAEGDTLAEVLAGVQQSLADGLGHSRYPTARILGDFRGQYPDLVQPGRYPLYNLLVSETPMAVGNGGDADWALTTATIAIPERPTYRLSPLAAAHDMALTHEALADGRLVLQWLVDAALYERETVESWALSLAALARHVAQGVADQPLPTLLPDEAAQLARWEHGPELASPASRFDRLFQDLARAQPEAPALITAAGVRTYAEVDAGIGVLAAALRLRGLRRGQVVGVLTDRSPALPAAVLAVWRAGGAYVPLTSDLPGDRLAFIAQDAGAQMILALDGHTPPDALAALGLPLLRPEEVRDVSLADEDLPEDVGADPAYILYTSGSTGTPKGVVVTHAGLMNLAVGMGERFGITPADRVLTLSSPTFDLWISDVVMAWRTGAALSPLTRAEMDDIAGMPGLIAGRGITVATMAPSYLRLFERLELPPLRILMTVGEAPIAADARHYAGRLACYNGYGPTENTAATTIGRIDPGAPRLTAGRPLPNVRVMILDAQGRQVPPGAIGEIWVAGASLAQGYLNRPDLTKRAFPTPPDGRRYRTGDLGRWTAGGELLVLGRTDGQVKLRGQRVELGEIAAAIEAQPGVRQAVVLVHKDAAGNQALYAFATGTNLPDNAAWRETLAQRLPSYMLPAAVIPVESIPTTLAGKVDQASLRARIDDYRLRQSTDGDHRAGTPPQGPVEERVAAIWSAVLKVGGLRREDDFFQLGGDSLRATAMVNRVRREFACTVNDLYENPRLEDFARSCRPQAGQLTGLIAGARAHWQAFKAREAAFEAARETTLEPLLAAYRQRYEPLAASPPATTRPYGNVLLTGATGYLGAYLLRHLALDPARRVTALVRGRDDAEAQGRLSEVLRHYFGDNAAMDLLASGRVQAWAGNLRVPDLGLAEGRHDALAVETDAILHCAANVNHYGHYRDSHADNVQATRHLLDLAVERGRRTGRTADMHFISTLSVCGRSPDDGYRLYTEYDEHHAALDDNYYVRSKQEAEHLVVAARGEIANASIHRVGNVVFAAEGGALQRNIRQNAFFRLTAALTRLRFVPEDMHAWLCHVDKVAEAVVTLAQAPDLAHHTHHVDHARRDFLAQVMRAAPGMASHLDTGSYSQLLERIETALNDPAMEKPLAELLPTFGVYRQESPHERDRRTELATAKTQALLARLGFRWPDGLPADGLAAMMEAARDAY